MKKHIKVLIVEDSKNIWDRVAAMFSDTSAIEIVGATGYLAEAKRLIDELEPDVVTLDLQLHDGSGIDLLREIKRPERLNSNRHNPRVVVLTNHSGDAFRSKCGQYGADAFLDKSVDFEIITDVLLDLTK